MATFKCLRSGNTVEINQQDDIDRMKFHEGYVLVEEKDHGLQETAQRQNQETRQDAVPLSKPGRPRKAVMEI